MQNPPAPKPSENLLQGAAAIADYLGGKWSPARVYLAHSRKQLPIRKRAGFGIYAFKSELDEFLREPPLATRLSDSSDGY